MGNTQTNSNLIGSFAGPPHAGGGVGGIDSPGGPSQTQWSSPAINPVGNVNGFVLQNGTPVVLQQVPVIPADGNNHLLQVVASKIITSAETGGAVLLTVTDAASGKTFSTTIFPGGSALGLLNCVTQSFVVSGGSTITILQQTALTSGASTLNVRVLVD